MSDTWPPVGPKKREPLLEHVRDLWTLHWQNDLRLELTPGRVICVDVPNR